MIRRRILIGLAATTVAAGSVLVAVPSSAEGDFPRPLEQQEMGRALISRLDSTSGTVGMSQYKNPSNPICTQTAAYGAVHRTDCEGNAPDNETSIAIDPSNADHMIAAGNDYQLKLSSGGRVNETAFTRAQVSTDGGTTWVSHPIAYNGYYSTGDPAVAIDADGRAYVATLGFVWSQGGPTGVNADILVAHSDDGGAHFATPSRVASGTGSWGSSGIFNDKEMITAWGHGNAMVTWTRFLQGQKGSYLQSPIYASVTHDGGKTWTKGVEISGSASFCQGSGVAGATACDQSQGSWPVVAADGSVYVYFLNTDPTSNDFDDQVLVSKVSPQTGALVAGPYRAAGAQDGLNDFPMSSFGDLTLQDSQFRVPSFGNIAADPTRAGHLVVTWSDMRNSPSLGAGDWTTDTFPDPYSVQTNSDVMMSETFDGGATWSAPTSVGQNTSNDQFFGSAAFLSDGRLVVGAMDRSFDPANHAYAYSLSVRTNGVWHTSNVSGALSDPTMNNRWFTGGLVLPGYAYPTTFIGDYTTVATSGMTARPLWTDLRNTTQFGSRTGADQQLMTVGVGY